MGLAVVSAGSVSVGAGLPNPPDDLSLSSDLRESLRLPELEEQPHRRSVNINIKLINLRILHLRINSDSVSYKEILTCKNGQLLPVHA